MIRERLDRMVANNLWMEHNPEAAIWHLRKEESNHCPILITTERKMNRRSRPFRLFEAWTKESSSVNLVKDAWNVDSKGGMHNHILNRSLRDTSHALQKWNKEVFDLAHEKIKYMERDLENLQERDANLGRQHKILEELRIQRNKLESINRQKSCELWLKAGDQNSKFFHLSKVIRHRKNKINCIKYEEEWHYGEAEIANYFKYRFEELFTLSHPRLGPDIDNLIWENITEDENNSLTRIPSEEEIKECVWSLHPLKSLGPDRFLGIFYRSYWTIVKEKLVNFVTKCFRCRRMPEMINKTFKVLIPKTNKACNFNQFHPISLCNYAYKFVPKILANRLSRIIDRLIPPNQRAFVKGRWIAENTVIAQEVIQRVRKHKGRGRLMVMKIDMKKAYD